MTFDFVMQAVSQTRRNMEAIMDAFSLAQLNAIPTGFRNNLIWNYGHVIVTQQLLCYRLAGQPTKVTDELIEQYRKGSAPDPAAPINAEQYAALRELSNNCLSAFAQDYDSGLFAGGYQDYETSFGIKLTSIEEASYFNLGHEALHLGVMMAMRKLV